MDNIKQPLNVSIPTFEKIFLIIQCICYLLYLMFVILFVFKIFKKNKNKYFSSFEFHFCFNFIFDFIQSSSILILQKFFHWQIAINYFSNATWILTLHPFIYIAVCGSIFGCLIVVVNRYCALLHPEFFKFRWTKKVSILIVFCQTFLSIIFFIHNFFGEYFIAYIPDLIIYYIACSTKWSNFVNNLLLSIISGTCSIITIILNIKIIIVYSRNVVHSTTKHDKRNKIGLIQYAIIVALSLFIMFLYQFTRLLLVIFCFNDKLFQFGRFFYAVICINSSIQPVAISLLSKSRRNEFCRFYFGCICFNKKKVINLCKPKVKRIKPDIFQR